MSEHANSPHKACSHRDAAATIGQAVFGERLVWTRSYSCPHCASIDDDSDRVPPSKARKLLLAANGAWELIVDCPRAEAMEILSSALGLSPSEANAYAHNLPYAYVGTKTEAEWLQAQMRDAGLRSRVERTSLPS